MKSRVNAVATNIESHGHGSVGNIKGKTLFFPNPDPSGRFGIRRELNEKEGKGVIAPSLSPPEGKGSHFVAIAARVFAFSGVRLGLIPEEAGEPILGQRSNSGVKNGTRMTLRIADDEAAAKFLQIIQLVFVCLRF